MPQRNAPARRLAAAAVLGFGIAACSSGLLPYPQFNISPRTVNVAVGTSQTVKIVLSGPNKQASWTVATGNAAVAQATQTDAGATIAGVAAGQTKVYVRAPAKGFPDDQATDSLTVNVTAAP
jgi:hypothetical protein